MGFFDEVNFEWNPLGTVVDVIKGWKLEMCNTEKEFEKSLAHFLEEKLEGIDVIRQYGSGRVKGDIVVGRKVLIEVKMNLDSTAKLQRLIGQLDLYASDWKKDVIIVLCGQHVLAH